MFYGKRQFLFMKLHLKTLESRRLKFVHSIKKKKEKRSSIMFKNEWNIYR